MSVPYLLDTDICSYFLRGRGERYKFLLSKGDRHV